MTHQDHQLILQGKVLAICEAVLNEEIGVIAGSRRLHQLGHELCDEHDEDFLTFVGIDSQTDHLPVDRERQNWSNEALQRKNKEIDDAEAFHKNQAISACRKLISRFEIKR